MEALFEAVCPYCGAAFLAFVIDGTASQFCSPQHEAASAVSAEVDPRRCIKCKGTRAAAGVGLCRACKTEEARAAVLAQTLQELRDAYPLHQYHAKVRGYARVAYAGPLACFDCGYSLHVAICHVRDLSKFPLTATIAEVNEPGNLVALCPTHHWEFDNGYLSVGGVMKPKSKWRKTGAPVDVGPKCLDCPAPVRLEGTRCRSCGNKFAAANSPRPTKVEWPSTVQLIRMVADSNWEAVGRKLGVSGNAVRKRVKSRPLDEGFADTLFT